MKYYVFLFMFLPLWVISCSDGQEVRLPVDTSVVFTPIIAGSSGSFTRASNNEWNADDAVGVYMVAHNQETVELPGLSGGNHRYITEGSGSATVLISGSERSVCYPNDGSEVNFIAYYPYSQEVGSALNNHVYPVDVTNQEELPTIDLLYHRGTIPYNYKSGGALLDFRHQLSKIVITVTRSSLLQVDMNRLTASLLNLPATAGFNLADGTLGAVGKVANITPCYRAESSNEDVAVWEAIVIPHEGTVFGDRIFVFTIGEVDYMYLLPDGQDFEAGVAYNYTLCLTHSDVVLLENAIVDWSVDGVTQEQLSPVFLTPSQETINCRVPATGLTFNVVTNSPGDLQISYSADGQTASILQPDWINNIAISKSELSSGYQTIYTVTFDATAVGECYFHLSLSGITKIVYITSSI